jgi:hypothetical protein
MILDDYPADVLILQHAFFCGGLLTVHAPNTAAVVKPELNELWERLACLTQLSEFVLVQQGRHYAKEQTLAARGLLSEKPKRGFLPALLRPDEECAIWKLPTRVWIDSSIHNDRARAGGVASGIAEVVMNRAPLARGPWRLCAVVDNEGLLVSNRFVVFQPKEGGPSLRALWALLNSPVANAYDYCASGKRETLVKRWRAFPIPPATREAATAVESAASIYLGAVEGADARFMPADHDRQVKHALLALDAEVLKLYDLPPRLERQLLDLFTGIERKGVGCDFRGYYPAGFTSYLPLHLVISERFERAAADVTADRFKPGESDYVRDLLAAAAGADEE